MRPVMVGPHTNELSRVSMCLCVEAMVELRAGFCGPNLGPLTKMLRRYILGFSLTGIINKHCDGLVDEYAFISVLALLLHLTNDFNTSFPLTAGPQKWVPVCGNTRSPPEYGSGWSHYIFWFWRQWITELSTADSLSSLKSFTTEFLIIGLEQ